MAQMAQKLNTVYMYHSDFSGDIVLTTANHGNVWQPYLEMSNGEDEETFDLVDTKDVSADVPAMIISMDRGGFWEL